MSQINETDRQGDQTAAAASATWKFDFLDTVNADPRAKGGCLGVIKALLHFASKSNPRAFCSLDELVLRTGSSRPAVRRAKENLIRLKYLEPEYVTDEGSTMYKLVNARKQLIDDHLRIGRESLAVARRERKKQQRKKGGNETCTQKNAGSERNVHPVWNETLPNTLDEYPRAIIYEGNTDYSVDHENENSYRDASLGDDPSIPFDVPADEAEAKEILDHAGKVHPLIRKQLHRMLMAGELTPSFLTMGLGGYDERSA